MNTKNAVFTAPPKFQQMAKIFGSKTWNDRRILVFSDFLRFNFLPFVPINTENAAFENTQKIVDKKLKKFSSKSQNDKGILFSSWKIYYFFQIVPMDT